MKLFIHIYLRLNLDTKKEQVILKDLQRHPHKKSILHADFQRVKSTDKITMSVPIHFVGEDKCLGVKQGGIVHRLLVDLEIRCKANALPEYIEIDISNLKLDESLHISELTLPTGVEIPSISQNKEQDAPVVSIHMPKQKKTEEAETADSSASTNEKSADTKKDAEKKEK